MQITADELELAESLKNGMGLLTHEQVERVANAVRRTNKGPLEALRGLSVQLVTLCEENPQAGDAELEEAAKNAEQTLVINARRDKERAEQYRPPDLPAMLTGALCLPEWRRAARQEIPEPPSDRTLWGANLEIKQLYGYINSIRTKLRRRYD